MAELLIKVRDGVTYKDGDILCAFSDRRILQVHAEHICHVKTAPRYNNGLIRLSALANDLLSNTMQFRFQRVSTHEVMRTDLRTGEHKILGKVPIYHDKKWQRIKVDDYVRNRIKSPRHRIFGFPGREMWHGGSVHTSPEIVAKIWDAIESKSEHRRTQEEYTLFPLGRLDIRHHLAIRTDSFTDEQGIQLTSGDSNRARVFNINWRSLLLDNLQETESNVLDREYPVGRDLWVDLYDIMHQSKPQPLWDVFSDIQLAGAA